MVSVAELMTIGTFASRTGLSVSALRFYAGQRLLVPAEVDDITGYRRYTEAQVPDGILVCNLRRLEMPLSEIAVALSRSEPERKQLVERHLNRLEQVVQRATTIAQTMGITPAATATGREKSTETTETTMSATLHTLDLAKALDQVLPAAGTDPELPHLMTVLIEGKAGSVRLVATDRHRLAVRDLVPASLDDDFAGVVPAATLSQWRASLGQPGELVVSVDQRTMHLAGDDVDLTAVLVPATFPDYEPLLVPADDVTSVRIDRHSLVGALEDFDGEETVVVSCTEGRLRLTRDQQEVEVAADCSGPDQQVGINPRYAIDAANHAVGAEVVIEIEDPLNPIVFRSADDGTFTSLVMPFKLVSD